MLHLLPSGQIMRRKEGRKANSISTTTPTTLRAVRLTFLAARTTTPLGVDFLFSARIVD
jgi:hypothetical protein